MLFPRRRPSADGLEHQPANAVVFRARMGQQVAGDARQPVGTKGIQTCLFDRVEQTRGVRILGLMLVMDRGVVKAPLEDDAVCEGAQAAVGRRRSTAPAARRRLDIGERTCARRHGATSHAYRRARVAARIGQSVERARFAGRARSSAGSTPPRLPAHLRRSD